MRRSSKEWSATVVSLPQRVSQRIIRDLRHDIQAGKEKGADIIHSAVITFVEKWLGFWIAAIAPGFVIGGLGLGLVAAAEWMSTVSILVTTMPWAITHVWILGFLTVLTYGVLLFSLVLVTGARLALWCQDTFTAYWNRHTPPFSDDSHNATTTTWPPTNEARKSARDRVRDFLGWGAIVFVISLSILLAAESIAKATLYRLFSSSQLAAIGNSFDVGLGIIDVREVLHTVTPGVTQPQLIFVLLVFVFPAIVMAIGARNFLFLTEGWVREQIDSVVKDGPLNGSTAVLILSFLYTIAVCFQIFSHWV